MDAGVRFPRGLLQFNLADLGNYDQCLGINEDINHMQIQGKWCFFSVPFNQTFQLPFIDDINLNLTNKKIVSFNNGIVSEVRQFAIRLILMSKKFSFALFNFYLF